MPRSLTELEQVMKPVILISDRDGEPVEFDNLATTTLVLISYAHHKIHEGDTFQSSYKSPDGSPIADDANLDILLIVGAMRSHMTFQAAAGGDAEIVLYEDTVVSSNGTRLVDANMNRNNLSGPTTATYHTPTVTTVGNQLYNELLAGGTGGNSPGGTARAGTERILRVGTTYLLRLTNRAGNAQAASLVVQWYEK